MSDRWCDDCVCDPKVCNEDSSGEHCVDMRCGACLNGCPEDVHRVPWDCLACPDGCRSCTRNESDCECYEHEHPDDLAEATP